MANKNVELMRGNPEKAVKTLAIPIMISMLLTASYNIIDGIWVAGLGQAAIAGIGFVTPIFMILNGVSVGLGSGATSSISRFVGAKNHEGANKSAAHYGTPLFSGLIAFMFGNGGSGILRGEGDMKRAMYAMIVSVVLNAILDPIFIYVLGLGSAGASLATIVSALGSASVILYWLLVKKDTYVNVSLREFKFDSKIAKDILKVGIPASMDMFMMSLAVSLYLVFISTIGGEYGIASFTSGQRLYLFAIMPLTAIGSAVAAVSGSAYGAENGDYLSRAHLYGVKFGIAFGTAVTIILVAFAPQLATLFAYTKETAVLVPEITRFLRIASLCLPLTGAGMTSSFMYQGIGRGTISLMWTIIREVIFTVTATYTLGIVLGWGLVGIWVGLALGRTLASILNFAFARFTIRKVREKFGT